MKLLKIMQSLMFYGIDWPLARLKQESFEHYKMRRLKQRSYEDAKLRGKVINMEEYKERKAAQAAA